MIRRFFLPLLAVVATSSHAASVDLTPALSGTVEYSSSGTFFPFPPYGEITSQSVRHSAGLETLEYNSFASMGSFSSSHQRGYIFYDLSGVDFVVQRATITVDLSGDLLLDEPVTFHELAGYSVGDIAALPNGTLPVNAGLALHEALGESPAIGSTAVGNFSFELDTSLLASINSGDTIQFGIVRPSGLSDPITFANAPILTLSDTAVVPLPAAAWLFGSAIVGLGLLRRRAAG